MKAESLDTYPYDTVQCWLHEGRVTPDEWEAYCYRWRNSTFTYSSLAEQYQEPRVFFCAYCYLNPVEKEGECCEDCRVELISDGNEGSTRG